MDVALSTGEFAAWLRPSQTAVLKGGHRYNILVVGSLLWQFAAPNKRSISGRTACAMLKPASEKTEIMQALVTQPSSQLLVLKQTRDADLARGLQPLRPGYLGDILRCDILHELGDVDPVARFCSMLTTDSMICNATVLALVIDPGPSWRTACNGPPSARRVRSCA